MMKQYQVTLTNAEGRYKPVSCIVNYDGTDKKEIQKRGITKICQKRYWGKADLVKYGYTRVKVREYDKEKIEQENKERYERLKEEKYLSGEWKRPKSAER